MQKFLSHLKPSHWPEFRFPVDRKASPFRAGSARWLLAAALILVWLVVLFGLPAFLDLHLAGWLTFLALIIMPGYLLADIVTWRLGLDNLERLALAFPLGVTVLSAPGILALLLHWTIFQLSAGWIVTSTLVVVAWLLHGFFIRRPAYAAPDAGVIVPQPWSAVELALFFLVAGALLFVLPTVALPKIDGDAYAVNSFAADALAGLPLNVTEPIFGTELGPGVRMLFNQSLPMIYLWSHLAEVDPNTLIGSVSRPMLAVWIILAAFTLGKAAGADNRLFGLLVAAIQLLIYLAAPFMRGDNVSLFFFERTNADKFLVPTIMLPVIFAFAIRYLRGGRRDVWLAAAVGTLAVSAIHPLIAAMQALALTAFGALHLLFGLRRRQTWLRTLALGGLVALVMVLPVVQLFVSRGEAPLASSYPSSFEGWPLVEKLTPLLPFVYVPSLDLQAPLPELAQLNAGQADEITNPFLLWRFAVNMDRSRLIVFDLDHYISAPGLILEPPYLLALLLLPLLLLRLSSSLAAQFAVGTSLAVLFVMFNPVITPLIGSLVMPWILWRFVWLLPYALIIALAVWQGLVWSRPLVERWAKRFDDRQVGELFSSYAPLGVVLVAALLLSPAIATNLKSLNTRLAAPVHFPVPQALFNTLDTLTTETGPAMVMADPLLSVTLPAYVARAGVVAHRVPTTSEVFPADQQTIALQRLIDQDTFYRTAYLTTESVEILQRYNVSYIIVAAGSDLDLQLRLADQWFTWLADDQSYSLYAVEQTPAVPLSILANTALQERDLMTAEKLYRLALYETPGDQLALLGLAEIAQSRGQFDEALSRLHQLATQANLPVVRFRLGQIYAEFGQTERSIEEFAVASQAAPNVARYYVALGDACLRASDNSCAAEQYEAAVVHQDLPDPASRLLAQADLWRQQGRLDQALPLYEAAVDATPSVFNRFVLAGAYRDAGQFEAAEALLQALQREYPFASNATSALAEVMGVRQNFEQAAALYRQAIRLQSWRLEETAGTRLLLAQVLAAANRTADALREIDYVLELQPNNALAYRLQGDIYQQTQETEQAIAAYSRAFKLDPTQIAAYYALSDALRQRGQADTSVDLLRTAIEANAEEPILFVALGDLRQWTGNGQGAIDAYQIALNKFEAAASAVPPRLRFTGESRAIVYARLARSYEELGKIEPALNYYQAAVTAAPRAHWAQILLGDAQRRHYDYPAAETAYRRAIEAEPGEVQAYLRLAELLAAKGQVVAANKLYDKALDVAQAQVNRRGPQAEPAVLNNNASSPTLASGETQPVTAAYTTERGETPAVARRSAPSNESGNLLRALSQLYLAGGQTDRAVQVYRERIQQSQSEERSPAALAQYYAGLGDLYLSQGRFDEAVSGYRQAVSLDDSRLEARLGLAQSLLRQGKAEAALEQLRTAVWIRPGSVEAQIALANTLDQLGEPEQALEIYREAAGRYPGQPQVTLAYAQAWHERNRQVQSEEIYRNTIAMYPGEVNAYLGLAELLIGQARYEEAETLLEQALDVDRQETNVYLRLGEIAERQGRPQQALAWYHQGATDRFAGQLPSVTLVDALIRYGDYKIALDYLDWALSRHGGQSDLQLRLARIQRMTGQHEEAAALLNEAVQRDSANDRLYAEWAALQMAQGDSEQAISSYRRAIETQPDNAAYYLSLSRILVSQGDFEQAIAVLESGQTQVADPSELYTTLASLHFQQGQPELALETLEAGIVAVGENETLLVAMGGYYMLLGNFEQVEQRYAQALELRPDAAMVYTALGDLDLRRDDIEAALENYIEATRLESTNPRHALALANAYRLAERPDEAIAVYEEVLAAIPTLAEAYTNLAALYQAQERWDEAQAVYEQGLTKIPTESRLLTQYSQFLYERGQEVEALAEIDQAVEIAPTAATLIARASLLEKAGQPAKAEQDLELALEKEPGSLEARIALGRLYQSQEQFESAEQQYQAAVSMWPGVPTGYLRLGDLANAQGDRAAAREYAKTAHDLEPGSLIRPELAQ